MYITQNGHFGRLSNIYDFILCFTNIYNNALYTISRVLIGMSGSTVDRLISINFAVYNFIRQRT